MDWENRKVLVAGGTGLIGANIVRRLLPLGATVRATKHIRPPAIIDKRIEYVDADLTNPEACKRIVYGMEYVFMVAARLYGVGRAIQTRLETVWPNILMHGQMLDASYRADVKKFLCVGSSTAYPESDKPVKEEEMYLGEPYEKYFTQGWVKRSNEKIAQIYAEKLERRLPTVVLRLANIYGEFDNFDLETSHMLPALVRKVVERQNPIEVWGTGNDVRDLLYVDDAVDAMLLAMEKVDTYNPINIAFGKTYTVKEVLYTIMDIEGYHPKIVFAPEKPTAIPERYIDISKAEKVLGWKPKTSLREGLKKTIEWYRRKVGLS